MSKKINLEEILEKVVQNFYSEAKDSDLKKFHRDFRNKAIELAAMKEACKQVLELAAEKASIDFVENKNYESSTQSDSFSFRDGDGNWCEISIYESSILSIINLIE